jgi:hypothetical protein
MLLFMEQKTETREEQFECARGEGGGEMNARYESS